jgi:hypothetical protein
VTATEGWRRRGSGQMTTSRTAMAAPYEAAGGLSNRSSTTR